MRRLSVVLVMTAIMMLSTMAAQAARNVLIVNGSTLSLEPSTTASITANLQAKHVAVSNTVTVADVPPGSLAGYDEVWDIRFSNASALSPGDQTLYTAFLQAGNHMFVMGENTGFMTRNNSISNFVESLGGGTLVIGGSGISSQTVNPPFTAPSPVTSIVYLAPGFSTPGAGFYATGDGLTGSAIAWLPGQLANAPGSALVVVFDVNFMQTNADADSQAFLENLISYINEGGQVERIPTLSQWGLIAMGLALLVVALRRRQAVAPA